MLLQEIVTFAKSLRADFEEAEHPRGRDGRFIDAGSAIQSAGKIFSHIGKESGDYDGFEKILAAGGGEYHVGNEDGVWHVVDTADGGWAKGHRRSPFKTRTEALAAINRKHGGKLIQKSSARSSAVKAKRQAKRVSGVNPAFDAPSFNGNHGLPLHPAGTHKGTTYEPLGKLPKAPKVLTRKATPADLADLEARGIKIAPTRKNIRVPTKPMTGPGAFEYMFDHHQIKSGKVVPNQRAYGQAADVAAQEHKFQRIERLAEHIGKLDDKIRRDAMKDDTAAAVALMRVLGMRPSSEAGDTLVRNAEGGYDSVKTFGATSLRHSQVTQKGKVTTFAFKGKAAHDVSLETDDPFIHKIVKARLDRSEGDRKLFDTTEAKTNDYIKSVFPDSSNKDLRTLAATQIAKAEIAALPVPQNIAEFRKAVKRVSAMSANQLQHGPNMSLASYINPQVFHTWAMAAGVDWEKFSRPEKGRTRVIKPRGEA